MHAEGFPQAALATDLRCTAEALTAATMLDTSGTLSASWVRENDK